MRLSSKSANHILKSYFAKTWATPTFLLPIPQNKISISTNRSITIYNLLQGQKLSTQPTVKMYDPLPVSGGIALQRTLDKN